MTDWKADRIGSAAAGTNPMVIARMESGLAVIGDTQFLPGYCLLLAYPKVNHLTDLDLDRRTVFLRDMSLIGEAIERAGADGGLRRINYEILGNTDQYLHAHVSPRYEWEPAERIGHPVFNYPRENWTSPEHQYDERRHGDLRRRIAGQLEELMALASGGR